jgi:acyl-CoA synthetase (AMP-forming)/AMP-acid ligase II
MRVIGDLVKYSAQYYPERTATVYRDIHLTYKELNKRVNRVSDALLKQGIRKGDHVGIICHTSHYFQEILYGIAKVGAVATTINWRLTPRESQYIIDDADVRALFVSDKYWETVKTVKSSLTKVELFILIGESVEETIDYEEFIGHSSEEEPGLDIAPEDVVWQIYTSGTTGNPKGVLLTHRNILADAQHNIIGNRLNVDNAIWLNPLPMFHVASKNVFMAAYVHATLVLMDNFDIKSVCETIEREKCTHLLTIAPTMWKSIMDYDDIEKYDLSTLKYGSYTTAPMPLSIIKRLKEKFRGITFFTTYGLTEAGSSLTILPADQNVADGPDHLRRRMGSLGRPMYGVDVRIVDDDDHDCPAGVAGEIIGRGDNIMKGYWKLPEETAVALKNGWLYTGDMGYWDEYGYIYMTDRKKDLIISGGENITPKEVEDVIREINGVMDVAVIGVPDDRWGESVKAVVIKDPKAELTAVDIINYCAKNLAGYKKPKSVDFVAEFPRSPVGKILKKEIRATYWSGR